MLIIMTSRKKTSRKNPENVFAIKKYLLYTFQCPSQKLWFNYKKV